MELMKSQISDLFSTFLSYRGIFNILIEAVLIPWLVTNIVFLTNAMKANNAITFIISTSFDHNLRAETFFDKRLQMG